MKVFGPFSLTFEMLKLFIISKRYNSRAQQSWRRLSEPEITGLGFVCMAPNMVVTSLGNVIMKYLISMQLRFGCCRVFGPI